MAVPILALLVAVEVAVAESVTWVRAAVVAVLLQVHWLDEAEAVGAVAFLSTSSVHLRHRPPSRPRYRPLLLPLQPPCLESDEPAVDLLRLSFYLIRR